jgi:hypothetical protein
MHDDNQVDYLKSLSENELLAFIRGRLTHTGQKKRFNFSGYEKNTGECTKLNQTILNIFSDLGIYDYTEYLFLDFYKGTPTLYLKYFEPDSENIQFEYSGYSTSEIILEIFKLTILSNKMKRRREW